MLFDDDEDLILTGDEDDELENILPNRPMQEFLPFIDEQDWFIPVLFSPTQKIQPFIRELSKELKETLHDADERNRDREDVDEKSLKDSTEINDQLWVRYVNETKLYRYPFFSRTRDFAILFGSFHSRESVGDVTILDTSIHSVKKIWCGMDYCLLLTEKSTCYFYAPASSSSCRTWESNGLNYVKSSRMNLGECSSPSLIPWTVKEPIRDIGGLKRPVFLACSGSVYVCGYSTFKIYNFITHPVTHLCCNNDIDLFVTEKNDIHSSAHLHIQKPCSTKGNVKDIVSIRMERYYGVLVLMEDGSVLLYNHRGSVKPYSELMGHSINRIISTRYETYFETFEGKYINVEGKLISDPELTIFLSNIDKHSSDICNSISITKNKEIFISGIMTNGCLFPKKEDNTFKQIDLKKYLGVEHRAFTDDPNCELHCGIGRYFAVIYCVSKNHLILFHEELFKDRKLFDILFKFN